MQMRSFYNNKNNNNNKLISRQSGRVFINSQSTKKTNQFVENWPPTS